MVALTLGQVYINVLLNRWNNTFYNALQDTDYAVFVRQVIRFSWLAAAYIVVGRAVIGREAAASATERRVR